MIARYSYRGDSQVPIFPDERPIIVFDGVCVLCSGWVDFVLKFDTRQQICFVVAQSDLGRAIYRHYGLDDREFPTNILLLDGWAYFKWDGSVRMFELLGWPWKAIRITKLLPQRWQERLYDWIAAHRFEWFGRREQCRMPTDELRARFLG
jgi:predicted DCC family thiol-disulfide oxidoreductase YuxK